MKDKILGKHIYDYILKKKITFTEIKMLNVGHSQYSRHGFERKNKIDK